MRATDMCRRYLLGLAAGAALFAFGASQACTRLVYLGANNDVITARSMDWMADIPTNLWIFPRGVQRTGETGRNTVHWTSKYGSVITSSWDVGTSDGVNEKGLEANILWLAESEYPQFGPHTRPGISVSIWAQYMLDNFATVSEAVAALQKEAFVVVTDKVPGTDKKATVHLSLSDATGDSAIIEYLGGKQIIDHDRKYQVMTNSPTFDQQLALNAYWKEIGGTVMLPGTNRASDRFVRASFYVNAIPRADDPDRAVAAVFSVIRNVSVPYGITTPDQPNISSTRWRTVFDHKRKVYFFESAVAPNVFWVNLNAIDFAGHTRKLELGPYQDHPFAGDATKNFKDTEPFKFLGVKD